ncbi:hypothetical protein [Bacteroides acidifaciens]|uniref:Cbp1 family collagen-binding glycoprotein adhesin n=1 Tax=Bacteroides acidifaciens TaxID=85831 RepID=UPI002593D290|nr:hypothetical protein [Bacteroides acidifaciens]
MVKLVVRIVAFFLIFGIILCLLDNCKGSSFEKFVDDIFSFSDNTKDTEDVSCNDIENADPAQLNIYVNIMLSNINQQYVTYNTTNIDISQTITSINTQIDNYYQSITNQTNYINRSNINQNTLINWATDNREFISKLEKQYQNLREKIDILPSEIKKLQKEIRSLEQSLRRNKKHFERYVEKYNRDVIEKENIKYEALIKELNERIEGLSSKIEILSKELGPNTRELDALNKTIKKCINKIKELNIKIDALIENSGNAQETEDADYYYIIDTEDNLKSKGIVSSTGLLGELSITSNPDKNYFAILTNKNKTIKLGREKDRFKLLSDMPSNSYEFRIINNKKVLIITDINNFWSKTKYLIIVKSTTKLN